MEKPARKDNHTNDLSGLQEVSDTKKRRTRGLEQNAKDVLLPGRLLYNVAGENVTRVRVSINTKFHVYSWNLLAEEYYDDIAFPMTHVSPMDRVIAAVNKIRVSRASMIFLQEVGEMWLNALSHIPDYSLFTHYYAKHQIAILIHKDVFSTYSPTVVFHPVRSLFRDGDADLISAHVYSDRTYAKVTLHVGKQAINIWNVHVPMRINVPYVMKTLYENLHDIVARGDIVIGDLNATPERMRLQKHVLRSSFLCPTNQNNRVGHEFTGEIDGVLYHKLYNNAIDSFVEDEDAEEIKTKIIPNKVVPSDHIPFHVVLNLTEWCRLFKEDVFS
jgi:endonuclease/exonuclease/phosphatase family metal-dependent hydrolase